MLIDSCRFSILLSHSQSIWVCSSACGLMNDKLIQRIKFSVVKPKNNQKAACTTDLI